MSWWTERTRHKVICGDAVSLDFLESQSVNLVLTSPPYPMIEMWDVLFASLDERIGSLLNEAQGEAAFERMHCFLDRVWDEIIRVLCPGGMICINIGDATRMVGDHFFLYPNHARIINHFIKRDMKMLPSIIWKKTTNSPNKFMGSGMLPGGAYVTLEHEYILIFRKGGKRIFKTEAEKALRRDSAYFWEERNLWFSDQWSFRGSSQKLAVGAARDRSAAFPYELAHRIVNMYSLKGDLVLDPFLGTGTSMFAAMGNGRSSVGVEIEDFLCQCIMDEGKTLMPLFNKVRNTRLEKHRIFLEEYKQKKELKHFNENLGMEVVTSQERELKLPEVKAIFSRERELEVEYI